jgi:hypothetical protein
MRNEIEGAMGRWGDWANFRVERFAFKVPRSRVPEFQGSRVQCFAFKVQSFAFKVQRSRVPEFQGSRADYGKEVFD